MSSAAPDAFVPVAKTWEVEPGSFVEVEVNDEVIVLANVEGAFYAVSAWCTHQGTSLALGVLDGTTLRCWAHLWRYDVRTGAPIWPAIAKVSPGYNLRTYPVRVEGESILIALRRNPTGPA